MSQFCFVKIVNISQNIYFFVFHRRKSIIHVQNNIINYNKKNYLFFFFWTTHLRTLETQTSIGCTGVIRDASTLRIFRGPDPLEASCWFRSTLSITSPRLREALKASYALGSTASKLMRERLHWVRQNKYNAFRYNLLATLTHALPPSWFSDHVWPNECSTSDHFRYIWETRKVSILKIQTNGKHVFIYLYI